MKNIVSAKIGLLLVFLLAAHAGAQFNESLDQTILRSSKLSSVCGECSVLAPRPLSKKVYEFINGNWFDGKTFRRRVFYSINGILTRRRPDAIDKSIDLQNGYVMPPFADSHTHSFDSRFAIKQQIDDSLRDGVFYAKVLNNFRSRAANVESEINRPDSIDVQYANGGLTGNYSHPIEVYEALSLGIYSYEQQVANSETIWQSRKAENDAYYIIESSEDLERKWQMILAGRPDFIKVFLRNGEIYRRRRSFIPKEWHRSDGGVDPSLVPMIVKKARLAGLRVSVANNSAYDFEVTVKSRADEVSHLPCYQQIDKGEKCNISQSAAKLAARHGTFITLITSEFEKSQDRLVIRYGRQNISLLNKYMAKFTLGSNSYGTTTLKGAIQLSMTGLFSNRELLKIWVENTPATIFPGRMIGHLKEGYEASFLVLKGDPLRNFSEVKRIAFRFKQGVEIRVANKI